MKAHVLMFAGVFLAALPAVGQSQRVEKMADASCLGRISSYSRPYLEKAAKNYETGLKCGNDGVVEACIAYSILLKVTAPQLDLTEIRAELDDIAASGNTPVIRYKAYVATIVFDNPGAFENILGAETSDSDRLFNTVAEQVSRTLIGFRAE